MPPSQPSLYRRAAAECLGTMGLLAAVVGSGIMGERLAAGNAAIALLANSTATAAALVALILTLGPVSGAHFNPAVTLAAAFDRQLSWHDVPAYLSAQIAGAFAGVGIANLMFGLPAFAASRHVRTGPGQYLGEFVATAGLLAVITLCSRHRPQAIPFAVASWIAAAYWFTSSTSFANPAVTLARSVTDTFAGIRPGDVPMFLAVQLLATAVVVATVRWLSPPAPGLST